MRKFYFRVWHSNRMIYWRLFRNDDTYLLDEDITIDEDTDLIMQYTGLKDKNGKDGYFGDLVKWGKAIYEVVWNEDDGIAALRYVKGREVFKYLRIKQIKQGEIIGNICENLELLEVKQC